MFLDLRPFGPREITGRDPRRKAAATRSSIAKLVLEMFSGGDGSNKIGDEAADRPERSSE
jgi:hypothetical protein